MSKIDDLLKKHCPNGVEYKKIKEVFTRLKGTPITATRMKEIECAGGEIRIFAGGKTVIDAKEKDIPNANITRVPAVLVQSRGVIDFIYYEKPFTFKNEMWAYTSDNKISVKYLFHVLKNNSRHFRDAASGMGALPQISLSATEDFVIPVPPLEVQREIVQVLDSFTMLTAELTAELTARKKQYEYYRDQLLSFNNVRGGLTFANPESVRWMTLGEIGTFERGRRFVHADDRDEGIPCIHYGELYTHYGIWADKVKTHINPDITTKLRYAEKGDVVIVAAGENNTDIGVGVAWLGNEKVAVHDACFIFRHKQNPKYISYLLRTNGYHQEIKKHVSEGKICSISAEGLAKAKFPVPPIEIQNRIVKVLDNFDSICSDLQIGLPAEIDARKKQYEYYRDLLLSFEPIGTVLAKQASKQ